MKRRRFIQDTIAVVYDFDGTLSPQPMQEYAVLPKLQITPTDFWSEANGQSERFGEEAMLSYMRLLLEKAEERHMHIGRREFRTLGRAVQYFPGVETWFGRVNQFVASKGAGRIKIRHYVVSAGLKEILDGISIKRHFFKIFASEYHYNHHGVATFPKLLITDTNKTQFLFRINKGRERVPESINSHMPLEQRPIPFENMIYIGDGETDVPGMTVTRQNGGNAIAVFKPGRTARARRTQAMCRELLRVGRANFTAAANYEQGSELERRVMLLLTSTIARIEYERELFECRKEHKLQD